MVKENDQIKTIDQLIERMEKHNLSEIKAGDIHIKKEKPQDIADATEQCELDERKKEEARRIAAIRLEQPTPEQKVD